MEFLNKKFRSLTSFQPSSTVRTSLNCAIISPLQAFFRAGLLMQRVAMPVPSSMLRSRRPAAALLPDSTSKERSVSRITSKEGSFDEGEEDMAEEEDEER